MSPYVAQAVERARLPVKVSYLLPLSDYDGDLWVIEYADTGLLSQYAESATAAYVRLRSGLEDGQ